MYNYVDILRNQAEQATFNSSLQWNCVPTGSPYNNKSRSFCEGHWRNGARTWGGTVWTWRIQRMGCVLRNSASNIHHHYQTVFLLIIPPLNLFRSIKDCAYNNLWYFVYEILYWVFNDFRHFYNLKIKLVFSNINIFSIILFYNLIIMSLSRYYNNGILLPLNIYIV